MDGNLKGNNGVRIIFSRLEDFVRRCRKRNLPEIYYRATTGVLKEGGRASASVEFTAMDYGAQEATNLIYVEIKTGDVVKSQEDMDAFAKDFQLRLYGGEVEVQKDGKKEVIRIPGLVPYVQAEYSGAELKEGWIGW
jgi:hypothetical protein